MKITFPKIVSFDLPEGYFRAALHDVCAVSDSNKHEKKVRLVWEIISLLHPKIRYCAARSYKVRNASALAHDLKSWLDDDFDALLNDDGEMRLEQLKTLIGREAVIEVIHIYNDCETAFRHVQSVLPPSTKIVDEAA
jgi:hypothetical protein